MSCTATMAHDTLVLVLEENGTSDPSLGEDCLRLRLVSCPLTVSLTCSLWEGGTIVSLKNFSFPHESPLQIVYKWMGLFWILIIYSLHLRPSYIWLPTLTLWHYLPLAKCLCTIFTEFFATFHLVHVAKMWPISRQTKQLAISSGSSVPKRGDMAGLGYHPFYRVLPYYCCSWRGKPQQGICGIYLLYCHGTT